MCHKYFVIFRNTILRLLEAKGFVWHQLYASKDTFFLIHFAVQQISLKNQWGGGGRIRAQNCHALFWMTPNGRFKYDCLQFVLTSILKSWFLKWQLTGLLLVSTCNAWFGSNEPYLCNYCNHSIGTLLTSCIILSFFYFWSIKNQCLKEVFNYIFQVLRIKLFRPDDSFFKAIISMKKWRTKKHEDPVKSN